MAIARIAGSSLLIRIKASLGYNRINNRNLYKLENSSTKIENADRRTRSIDNSNIYIKKIKWYKRLRKNLFSNCNFIFLYNLFGIRIGFKWEIIWIVIGNWLQIRSISRWRNHNILYVFRWIFGRSLDGFLSRNIDVFCNYNCSSCSIFCSWRK